MFVLGIDLAAQPSSTGAVVLQCEPGGSSVRGSADRAAERWSAEAHGPADDELLLELGASATAIGVDCPLGWPAAFVDAVSAHHRHDPWPADANRRPLTHRLTDHELRARGQGNPMSVSADLLGHVAMRCAWLQREWSARRGGEPAWRDGSTWLMEVYPAASLRAWGLPSRGYKVRRGADAEPLALRHQILDAVVAALGDRLELGEVRERCLDSDHLLDALIAALTVLVVRAGGTTWPLPEQRSIAQAEGWIHVPVGALDVGAFDVR
jgi:predicted nuclease with RNAse H fold